MKTYNTYQEAKIANPKSEIYVWTGWTGWKVNDELATPAGPFAALDGKSVTADCWIKCHPKDYCMSLAEFLAKGHKLARRDVFIDEHGEVQQAVLWSAMNNPEAKDNERYILRAKALEQAEIDTTPQQVEIDSKQQVFASDKWKPLNQGMPEIKHLTKDLVIEIKYDESCEVCEWTVEDALKTLRGPWRHTKSWRIPVKTPKQVESLAGGEWKNGDECKYMNNSVIYKFIGIDTDDLDCCWIKAPSGQLNMVGIHHLSSTAETPQQRKEREELEAAYELYCVGHKALQHETVDFDVFKGLLARERYLAIARETKYRKEAK